MEESIDDFTGKTSEQVKDVIWSLKLYLKDYRKESKRTIANYQKRIVAARKKLKSFTHIKPC